MFMYKRSSLEKKYLVIISSYVLYIPLKVFFDLYCILDGWGIMLAVIMEERGYPDRAVRKDLQ